MPRNSQTGMTSFEGKGVKLSFQATLDYLDLYVDWPAFDKGQGIHAEIRLRRPRQHQSMNIVIPIEQKRFYYNSKVNCMPAEGKLSYGVVDEILYPASSCGSLDWGRGVWAYKSFWNWASASGFLPDGRGVGLNLGCGFGDTSAASEDCLVLDGRVHKLDRVKFIYDARDYRKPWKFQDNQGRLELDFTPFVERVARTDMKLIFSEVHQVFGRYSGQVRTDDGEIIELQGLIGFAEEHQARW